MDKEVIDRMVEEITEVLEGETLEGFLDALKISDDRLAELLREHLNLSRLVIALSLELKRDISVVSFDDLRKEIVVGIREKYSTQLSTR